MCEAVALYNTNFLLNVKLDDFNVFLYSDYEMALKMFYHPPDSLENYICDIGKNTNICSSSQRFPLESGKRAAIG
jgi:hypothetical protein